jgi:hypothetical protein
MASDTPAPAREERSEARIRELIDLLTWQLDSYATENDFALQSVLYAYTGELGRRTDAAGWQVVSMLTGGGYDDQPESAANVQKAGVRLLAALYRAMGSHAHSGKERDVVWGAAHVWIVELLSAQDEMNAAIEALEADALRLESSNG